MVKKLINTDIKLGEGTILQEALNGFSAEMKNATVVTLDSNDRDGWLKLDSGLYYIGAGISRGYPSDYFMFIHMKVSSALVYQLGVTNSNNSGTNWLRYRLINNNINSRISWSTL